MPSLTALDLTASKLGDAGVGVIAGGLALSRGLRRLVLARCGMGEAGATALANALRVNTTLTQLDVRGCDEHEAPAVDEQTLVAAAAVGQDLSRARRHESLRRVFGVMVADVIETSRGVLEEADPESVEAVRHQGRPAIAFSDDVWRHMKEIKAFLFRHMYRAPSVVEMRKRVTAVVEELFPFYMEKPEFLPKRWQEDVARADSETALARLVCDYIAGMTDRFALESHARLLGGPGGAGERRG